jgi:hypothetical protein
MDEIQKSSNSGCHTPSSEPFLFYEYVSGLFAGITSSVLYVTKVSFRILVALWLQMQFLLQIITFAFPLCRLPYRLLMSVSSFGNASRHWRSNSSDDKECYRLGYSPMGVHRLCGGTLCFAWPWIGRVETVHIQRETGATAQKSRFFVLQNC